MFRRLINLPESFSFFLFGARATGKTTLLREQIPSKCRVDFNFLDEDLHAELSRHPQLFADRLEKLPKETRWIFIDEVQRIPEILNIVHEFISRNRFLFALTGSSARKLRRGGANLLAGRALVHNLFPLTSIELGEHFDIEDAMAHGTLPQLFSLEPKLIPSYLRTYAQTYVKEEVLFEQLVRKITPFRSFLSVAAQMNGKILNYSAIARDIDVDYKTVQEYFSILEDTLIGFFLEPYHRSIRKRQRQQAKFYLFDTGVKRALEGSLRASLAPRTYEWGKAFEHLVLLEAYRLNAYLQSDYRFSYLRTHGQLEVDLIAERKGDTTWAIEIKSGSDIDEVEVRKLQTISEDIPNSQPVILCTTEQPKRIAGVDILPWKIGLDRIFDG